MSAARPIQCCRRDSRQEMPLHHGANVAELHPAPLQNHPYLLVAEALSTRLLCPSRLLLRLLLIENK